MERQKLERLIAMLEPGASEECINFVIDKIMNAFPQSRKSPPRRSDQQNVDPYDSSIQNAEPYESTLANDPRFW